MQRACLDTMSGQARWLDAFRAGRGDLEIRVDLVPLADGRHDVERHQLVAHLAQVLVAGIQLSHFLGVANGHLIGAAVSVAQRSRFPRP